jgi:hypothetical protein
VLFWQRSPPYRSAAIHLSRLACADSASLKNATLRSDFFSLSDCRDLLFNVQKTRHTLSHILAFVTDNDLTMIGFEVDPLTSCNYLEKFPDDVAMTNLMHWRQYETENPFTFVNMYNFWVQKKALINNRCLGGLQHTQSKRLPIFGAADSQFLKIGERTC